MPRCSSLTVSGKTRCKMRVREGCDLCHVHSPRPECSICFSEMNARDAYGVGCGGAHVFHRQCVQKWFVHANTCPMCREKIVNPMSHTRDDLISYMTCVIEANATHMLDDHLTVFHMDDTFRLESVTFVASESAYSACFCMGGEPIMYFLRQQ